ncbi:VPLPA-CTERM sorting domain-containing protein [Pseudorhodobacter turbinis]|uniref:VPLPA-CTERM sorting domain-containing protein n=1 Tax=Pseudorhodobacter turbinis TaxID=2500533 RepID=A0A4P8EFB1_9RHOB|nr:glycerophosphodiester phosphodiesterase family protein [Pseudorhodobacter turbinis]QCO55145.1 VPLPA-CTERM sorting domain-containing protein [Pseudorhodobacter turbinis]
MKPKMKLAVAAVMATTFSAPMLEAATAYNTLTGEAPVVVAHRGASGYLPEETLGGYELAMKMGADYIEPDVQMTADGQLVAMHDSTLTRTTNVADLFAARDGSYKVSDFTLEEIKSLTVKPTGALSAPDSTYAGFTPSMADPYKVPTLSEVLDLLTEYNTANGTEIGIYPESKTPYNSPQNQAIVATLKDKGYDEPSDKVILQSFVRESIIEMGEALIDQGVSASLAQLGGVRLVDGVYGVSGSDGFFSLAEIADIADGVGVSAGGITEEFITSAHDLGLIVHAYTFRPLSEEAAFAMIQPMLDWGLDGFFTDYTDFSRTVVDANAPSAVPLPAGLPLLFAGLGGLAMLRRRKAA